MPSRRNIAGLIIGRVVLALLLVVVVAYPLSRTGLYEWPRQYDPLALPDLDRKPNFLTPWQMKLIDADAQNCAIALSRTGLSATLQPTRGAGTDCEVAAAVTLSRLSLAKVKAEETRCALAARLYVWERNVLQPEARRIFGEPVSEILHFGSFSCRTMRNRGSMSEHATANAFDISGFRLASGKIVSVKKDWPGSGKEALFLRRARDGLCETFNLTLSPDYNADHADHFHVDMGWWRSCR